MVKMVNKENKLHSFTCKVSDFKSMVEKETYWFFKLNKKVDYA